MRRVLRSIRQFLSELKRRNVYRVGLAYLAAGFVVVELADIAAGTFDLPGWFGPMVWVVVGLGFPIALVIAWAFEVTPEGVRVEEPEGEEETAPAPASTTRDLWIGGSVLVLLLVGAWALFGGLAQENVSDPVADQAVDSTRVAVFPFAVGGGNDIAYLGENMVELMGRSIDGAGGLRVVDPNTLLGRLGKTSADGVRPEEARRVAAQFGAGRYVLGRVLRLGDRVRLSGTWYAVDGTEIGSAETLGQGAGDIQRLVDELAREAIADLTGGGPRRRRRLAAQTTSSAEALKAYLEGQQALRAGNLSAAMDAFTEALETDSTFALAHYRLSLAAGWSGQLDAVHRHGRRAVEYSENLPEQDRRLLRACAAYYSGEAERAERLYRTLLQRRPDDAEAQYMLGETLFHHNSVQGRSVAEASGPFRRAMQLDPTFNQPLIHQVQIAVLQEKNAWLDSLTSGLESRDLATGAETMYRAVRAYALTGEIDSGLRNKLRKGRPLWPWWAAYTLMAGEKPAAVDTLAGVLTPSNRPEEMRAGALALQADARATQGRLRAARQTVAKIVPLDSATYWMARARLAGLPFVPDNEGRADERRKVTEGLEAWAAGEVPGRLLPEWFLRPREMYPAGRLYHLGLLRVQRGDVDGALQAARQLESTGAPFFASSGPSDLARSVRASAERRRDRPKEALRHLEAMENRIDPMVVLGRLYSAARERFVRAELLAEMGRPEEALRWYRTLDGVAYGDLPYIAPAHFGRARVLEKLGRPREAADAYRRVLDLWTDADPVLQPKVEDARQRLANLKESARTVSATESQSSP